MQCCLCILQIVLLHCAHAHNGCNVSHKCPIDLLGLVREILPSTHSLWGVTFVVLGSNRAAQNNLM